MKLRVLAVLLTLVVSQSAQADTNWKNQFAGLDGVVVICVSSTKLKASKRLCNSLSKHIAKRAKTIGADTEVLGYVKEGDDAPSLTQKFKTPLVLKIFLRGTPKPYALSITTRAIIPYTNAIEAGESGTGRSGELMIYERATLGSGPRKQLRPAILQAAKDRLEPFLVRMEENWQ